MRGGKCRRLSVTSTAAVMVGGVFVCSGTVTVLQPVGKAATLITQYRPWSSVGSPVSQD